MKPYGFIHVKSRPWQVGCRIGMGSDVSLKDHLKATACLLFECVSNAGNTAPNKWNVWDILFVANCLCDSEEQWLQVRIHSYLVPSWKCLLQWKGRQKECVFLNLGTLNESHHWVFQIHRAFNYVIITWTENVCTAKQSQNIQVLSHLVTEVHKKVFRFCFK